MTYDPRAFPTVKRRLPPSAPAAPTSAPKPDVDPFASKRREAIVFSIGLIAATAALVGWVESRSAVPMVVAPPRAGLTAREFERWQDVMKALAERRAGGKFGGTGPDLRVFSRTGASDSSDLDTLCAAAGWTKDEFLTACEDVQTALDLIRARQAGWKVFPSPAEKAAIRLVKADPDAVQELLGRVR